MSDMPIRKTIPLDEPEWFRMRISLWPEYSPVDLRKEMSEIAAQPDHSPVFVVVRPDGRLAGFLEANLRTYAEGCQTGKIAYIEGWYIDPDVRRQGFGRKLVQAAEAWARSMGCTEIASDCLLTNATSHLAHTALGYREVERLIHFHKKLADARIS